MGYKKEILVAGGGIGGIATALMLGKQGREVRVLERAPAFGEIGYGLQLGPNAYRMLEALGIADRLSERAVFPKHLVMLDAIDGSEITRMDLGDAFTAHYGSPYSVMHRSDLHAVLLEECRKLGNVQLETDRELSSFSQDEGGVTVECQGGERYEADALIGADGLRSRVRAAIIGDGAPRRAGQVAYRGVVPVEQIEDRDHLDAVVVWVGHNMHVVQYRLRGGSIVNTVAVVESEAFRNGLAETIGPDELESIFEQAVPQVRRLLSFVDKTRHWVLQDRDPQPGWTQGRVTLLGDAAHPTLQYLAQGACMALEDAVLLAREAQDVPSIHDAFAAYERKRYLHTARVQLTSRFFCGVCHAGGGARDLRNGLLRNRSHRQYGEVDWLYRGLSV